MMDNPWLLLGVFPLAAYVIGATPVGFIIARCRGVDIRRRGSGNVGATNVSRVLGRSWGLLCLVLDAGKGFAPVLATRMLMAPDALGAPSPLAQASLMGVAMGAILGHVFSFYLKFHGGKGVATSLGVVLGVFPYFTYPALAAMAVWIVVSLATRYESLGSMAAAVAFLIFFAAFNFAMLGSVWLLGVFAAAMVCLIIARHSGNIRRLLAGTENKMGSTRETDKR